MEINSFNLSYKLLRYYVRDRVGASVRTSYSIIWKGNNDDENENEMDNRTMHAGAVERRENFHEEKLINIT